MSWWPILLIYVLPSIGLFALITALVVGPRMARRPRYRVGQPWPHQPLWWTANPAGAQFAPLDDHDVHGRGVVAREAGGARGSW